MDELSPSDLAFDDLDVDLQEQHREVFDDLRSVLLEAPPDDVAADHVDAMHAAATEVLWASRTSRRRSRAVVASAIGAGALVIGGVAAATGSLPGPVQGLAAALAAPFGVDLPDGDGNGSESPPLSDDGTSPRSEGDRSDGSGEESEPATPPSSVSGTGSEPTAPPASPEAAPPEPENPEVAPGPTSQPGNRPEIPPGQTEQPGNRPDVPPGHQSVAPGNSPDSPPGQSGQSPVTPPGLSAAPGDGSTQTGS
jgi:hypothetical protein